MTPTRRLPLSQPSETLCIEFVSGPVRLRLERVAAASVLARPKAPVLLYRFTPVRRTLGDVFLLLRPGAPLPPILETAAEVMVAACDDCLAPGLTDRRWRQDPGVRALAHELRRALIEVPRPPEAYLEHLVRAMLLRAQEVLAAPNDGVGGGLAGPRLERVMTAIEAGFRDRLTLEDLARAAGMSRARFAEAFRRTLGVTPYAYVRTKRLEAVRAALESGEPDLARLAARFGFSSHAHMTTAFRTAFGVTPSAYRRAVASEDRGTGPARQFAAPDAWELGGKARAFGDQRP